jgi:hypothetical protein
MKRLLSVLILGLLAVQCASAAPVRRPSPGPIIRPTFPHPIPSPGPEIRR